MAFLFPTFLWALLALAIPIIVHLFQFRRFKTVYFSNVAFLNAVFEDNKSRSNIKKWLLLFARLLAVSFLVFAFAQPYFQQENSNGTQPVGASSVFIDNSLSMESSGFESTLLEEAKQRALRIAQQSRNGVSHQILTQQFAASEQLLLNKQEATEQINRIQTAPQSRSLSSIIERQRAAMNKVNSENKQFIIVSDFQKSTVDWQNIQPLDSTENLVLVPLPVQTKENSFIDSIWIDAPIIQPGENLSVNVSFKRQGGENTQEIPVELRLNGEQYTLFSIELAPDSKLDTALQMMVPNESFIQASIHIDDAGMTYDNDFYFALNIQNSISVLEVTDESNSAIRKAFATDSSYQYQQANPGSVSPELLEKAQFIILNSKSDLSSGLYQLLSEQLQAGKNILIFPPKSDDLTELNQFLASNQAVTLTNWDTANKEIREVAVDNPIYQNVFAIDPDDVLWPNLTGSYQFKNGSVYRDDLMKTSGGYAAFVHQEVSNGHLFIASFPLQSGNFANHPIFLPTLFRASLFSNKQQSLYGVIGEQTWINTSLKPQQDNTFQISDSKGNSFIPQSIPQRGFTRLETMSQIQNPGFYTVNGSDNQQEVAAFNYSRNESEINYLSANELEIQASQNGIQLHVIEGKIEDTAQQLSTISEIDTYWRLCLLLALLFLAAEVVITRFMK